MSASRPAELSDRDRLASDHLWTHWSQGRFTDALPIDCRPADRRAGYAVQAGIERHSTQPPAGWKIAATSVAGQKHIAVSGPLAGRLLAERIVDDGAELTLQGNGMRVVEPEFAFKMGRDLPPRAAGAAPYTVDEVMAAVADLHLALEVPSSRYADFTRVGEAQLIADNACAHDFVLGPLASGDWRSIDLSQHRVLGQVQSADNAGGTRHTREGIGANVLGDPRIALTWLANELSGLGLTLTAGQVVTTGTCMVPLEVEPGDQVVADFGVLGQTRVRFSR